MKNALFISLLCLLSSLAVAQQFYRWTDAEGTTHYTRTPPPDASSTSLEVATGATHRVPAEEKSKDTDSSSDASQTASQKSESVDDYVKTYKKRCDQYRKNLKMLNSDKPLVTKGDDGKSHQINDQKRAAMKQRITKLLTTCNAQ